MTQLRIFEDSVTLEDEISPRTPSSRSTRAAKSENAVEMEDSIKVSDSVRKTIMTKSRQSNKSTSVSSKVDKEDKPNVKPSPFHISKGPRSTSATDMTQKNSVTRTVFKRPKTSNDKDDPAPVSKDSPKLKKKVVAWKNKKNVKTINIAGATEADEMV